MCQTLFSSYPVTLVNYFCEDRNSQDEIKGMDTFSYVVVYVIPNIQRQI